MLSKLHAIWAILRGKNSSSTPKSVIVDQMNERRSLPVGATEFEEWSDRIISGSLLPAEPESMKFALATMLLHLGPQESHREDAYFIHSLRKSAVNQIAHTKMQELKGAAQARLDAEKAEADKKAMEAVDKAVQETLKRNESTHTVSNKSEVTRTNKELVADAKVLENN